MIYMSTLSETVYHEIFSNIFCFWEGVRSLSNGSTAVSLCAYLIKVVCLLLWQHIIIHKLYSIYLIPFAHNLNFLNITWILFGLVGRVHHLYVIIVSCIRAKIKMFWLTCNNSKQHVYFRMRRRWPSTERMTSLVDLIPKCIDIFLDKDRFCLCITNSGLNFYQSKQHRVFLPLSLCETHLVTYFNTINFWQVILDRISCSRYELQYTHWPIGQ